MMVSVITPSFRQSSWLKLCIASVADQSYGKREHIVQDAMSDDGTLDWLSGDGRIRSFAEVDLGMYDAINRGIGRARGEIIAHLNCDEQYLPGTLASVVNFFEQNKDIDVIFADVLVVDAAGKLICFQKVVQPSEWQIKLAHLPTYTAATFFRRRVIEKHHLLFRANLKALADSYWALDLLKRGIPFAVMRRYAAIVTETGRNLSLTADARRETIELYQSASCLARSLRLCVKVSHCAKKLLTGCYTDTFIEYDIYTNGNLHNRTHFAARLPSPFWLSVQRQKNREYYRNE